MDIDLPYGGDLTLNATGSIAFVSGWQQLEQRVVRSIFTAALQALPDGAIVPPDYIYDTAYGIGAGKLIGQNPTRQYVADLKRRVAYAIQQDTLSDPAYVPTVSFEVLNNGTLYLISATLKLAGSTPQTLTVEMPA